MCTKRVICLILNRDRWVNPGAISFAVHCKSETVVVEERNPYLCWFVASLSILTMLLNNNKWKHFGDSKKTLSHNLLYLIYYVGFWRGADFREFEYSRAHLDSTFGLASSSCPSLLLLHHCFRSFPPSLYCFYCLHHSTTATTTLQQPLHCCHQPSSDHPGTPISISLFFLVPFWILMFPNK